MSGSVPLREIQYIITTKVIFGGAELTGNCFNAEMYHEIFIFRREDLQQNTM